VAPASIYPLSKQPLVGVNTEHARLERLRFLSALGHDSGCYINSPLTAQEVKGNVESFLGAMSMPVGLVGPLLYTNDQGELEQVFAPVATTEGALIASMNRGVSVLNRAGGFSARVKCQRMLRAPMFCFENMTDAADFETWLHEQLGPIREHIARYSAHAKLVEIKTDLLGRNLMCQFYYETGDASGQNMTTICTWQACILVEREYNRLRPEKIQDFMLESNGSSDKKVSHGSMMNGRGIHVVAECVVSEELLRSKLKVTSKSLLDWFTRTTNAAQVIGMLGYNVNIANPIAAIFAATGQDLACVHESSVGHLSFEEHPLGLYASLKMPGLVIATVGGGTSLPFQGANLRMMGCQGANKVRRFAELIAGYCLGLELSTFAAMANGQFALAHERLGRNKPIEAITNVDMLTEVLQDNFLRDRDLSLRRIHEMSENNGIVTEFTSQTTPKHLGLSVWEASRDQERELTLLKSKPTDRELLNCMYILTGLIDPQLAKVFDEYKSKSDFVNSHVKEILLYEEVDSEHMPRVYGTMCDHKREAYLILMSLLTQPNYRIINSEMEADVWDSETLKAVIRASVELQRAMKPLQERDIFGWSSSTDYLRFAKEAHSVLREEYGGAQDAFMDLYQAALNFLEECDEEALPRTLIHNDYNPRNVAVSNEGQVVAYDYELARVDVPQRDIIEFLSFVLGSDSLTMSFHEIMAFYRAELDELDSDWDTTLKFALSKYIATRVNLYMLGNQITRYPFLDLVLENCVSMGRELGLS
jgi:hydroxymethylglutaryl-CoA reductase (NADPH)